MTKFEKKLQYRFKNQSLLKESLTHKSCKKDYNNERLEFLGDAVLDLIVGEYLFDKFPNAPEGELSKMRASIVNEKSFAKIAQFLNIGEHLYISHAEDLNNGRKKASILSNAFEAIIGAIYLESGLSPIKAIVYSLLEHIYPQIDLESLFDDHKTALQELTQSRYGDAPQYLLISTNGPDHNKEFIMGVNIQGKEYARAKGKSKKEAQQNCAKIALAILKAQA